MSWSPETGKKRLVSGGCDNMVKIWSQDETGSWVAEANGKLEGHSDWVRDVAWAPSIGSNRSIIASCSQDRRVIIWTNEGTPLFTSDLPHIKGLILQTSLPSLAFITIIIQDIGSHCF